MLVHQFLENSASRLGEKVALVCDGRRLTYREINEQAEQLASYLVTVGVKRQDRVIIFLDNSAEAVIAIFGILKAGCAFVLLNSTMKSGKLNYILKDSGARALITHSARHQVVTDAIVQTPDLEHLLWCLGEPADGPPLLEVGAFPWIRTSVAWSEAFSPRGVIGQPRLPTVIDVDLATIIYTSGSTGEPKGVVSAHYNVVAAARSITTYLRNVEGDIIHNCLPLSFDYGLYQVLMAFLFGGTVVLEKSFVYPYKVMERLVAEGVTGFPIVPTMVAVLLQMEDLGRFDCSKLRYLTNTGATLPVTYIRKIQRLFPNVTIFSMYGLTECKRVSYLPPEQLEIRPDSVGIAIPNTEVFIVDAEGNEVGPHEVGELVVRGSHVMQGYWNAPEETARSYRPGRHRGEALLYTGDLFRKDEEGFLYFVARKDDLIKTKGERVSPKEIENALCAMEGVAEAAVIGVPDDIMGKAIKAFIIPFANAELSEAKVQAYCNRTLEPFMVPKYVEFRTVFPKSPSGKVNKKELC